DFGDSLLYKGRTVKSLITERFSNTLYVGLFAVLITVVDSIPIGIYSTRNPYSLLDYSATTFGFLCLAIPNFFFVLHALSLPSINLGCLPAQGTVSNAEVSGLSVVLDRIHQMVLPGITFGLAGTASYMRDMRSEVLDVLGSDYI